MNGDTWGISGPTFLLFYVAVAGLVVLAATGVRRRLADVPARPCADLAARPYDVAYLNGGAELAICAALSAMYRGGTLTTARRGVVAAAARPEVGAEELDRAIARAAARPVTRRELAGARAVSTALARIESLLVDGGLLLSAEQRRRIRAVGGWTSAVAVLGVARLVAGLQAGRPVGYLVVALAAVTAVGLVQLTRAPRRTRAGDDALAQLVREQYALSPAMRPDWAVYGPAGAALSVGVYGMGALWASDPAFAAELAARRQAAGTAGGSSSVACSAGSGCSGGGGGGGCGGGGCGG
jgi:uncharacterized protein (TIGR04222 family)